MEISPSILAKMLIVAFLFGIQSGIVFDAGRALRAVIFGDVKSERIRKLYNAKLPFSKREFISFGKSVKKVPRFFYNSFIFLCDFVWIVYSFFGLMKINYAYNDGGLRGFTVLGLIAGYAVYYFTVSRFVFFVLEFLSFAVRYTFFTIFDAVSLPFFNIYNKLVKKIKKRCENIRFRIEKKRKKVYNVSEILCENASTDVRCGKIRISISKKTGKERGENEK